MFTCGIFFDREFVIASSCYFNRDIKLWVFPDLFIYFIFRTRHFIPRMRPFCGRPLLVRLDASRWRSDIRRVIDKFGLRTFGESKNNKFVKGCVSCVEEKKKRIRWFIVRVITTKTTSRRPFKIDFLNR